MKTKYKFRLVHGLYIQNEIGPDGKVYEHTYRARRDYNTNEFKADPPDYSNDIIESDQRLDKRFNLGGHIKFELLIADTTSANQRVWDSTKETLEQFVTRMEKESNTGQRQPAGTVDLIGTVREMTIDELRQWAAQEEIDLRGAKTKAEMMKIVEQALEVAV